MKCLIQKKDKVEECVCGGGVGVMSGVNRWNESGDSWEHKSCQSIILFSEHSTFATSFLCTSWIEHQSQPGSKPSPWSDVCPFLEELSGGKCEREQKHKCSSTSHLSCRLLSRCPLPAWGSKTPWVGRSSARTFCQAEQTERRAGQVSISGFQGIIISLWPGY